MKHFQQTIRRLRRIRLRTRTLVHAAVICALAAVMMLALALYAGHFLSADSYIAGFNVTEIADEGETLRLSGANGRQLTLSRREMGSDSYFRVKKSIAQGSFVRAKVHHNILEELQIEGKTVYRPEEGSMLGIDAAAYLLILTAFFFFAALVLAAAVAMRRDRRRRRKNKK